MTTEQILNQIKNDLLKLKEEETLAGVNQGIKNKIPPQVILKDGLGVAMQEIGEKFEIGEYFLAELVVAAQILNKALEVVEPLLAATIDASEKAGTIVIGTVKGDIHDIGKNIVAALLRAGGFTVHDLGFDVAPSTFIQKAKELKANIIASSSLITTTMDVQRDIEDALKNAGLKGKIKTMVGGLSASKEWAQEIGADGWAETAIEAVDIAKQVLKT
jgi:corrinoid protein of di/trimethylamine methyltransferase